MGAYQRWPPQMLLPFSVGRFRHSIPPGAMLNAVLLWLPLLRLVNTVLPPKWTFHRALQPTAISHERKLFYFVILLLSKKITFWLLGPLTGKPFFFMNRPASGISYPNFPLWESKMRVETWDIPLLPDFLPLTHFLVDKLSLSLSQGCLFEDGDMVGSIHDPQTKRHLYSAFFAIFLSPVTVSASCSAEIPRNTSSAFVVVWIETNWICGSIEISPKILSSPGYPQLVLKFDLLLEILWKFHKGHFFMAPIKLYLSGIIGLGFGGFLHLSCN